MPDPGLQNTFCHHRVGDLTVILLTVDPATLAVDALRRVDDIFAVGDKAAEAIASFALALSIPTPELPQEPLAKGEALFRRRSSGKRAQIMKPNAPVEKAERHIRKYAESALGEDKSFYFRAPRTPSENPPRAPRTIRAGNKCCENRTFYL